MAYRLKPGKLTGKAVRRIANEQTSRALASLTKDEVTPADVHEGRKVVKRLRSLLKLIEPALTPADFAKHYKSLGRAGDLLAGARDRHVMEQTIGMLEKHFGPDAIAALGPIRTSLEGTKGSEPSQMDAAALTRARKAFAKEARDLAKLKIGGKGMAVFSKGLEDTYKTARTNFARAYAKPDDEHFHEMRKAVQWHWRHMALLSRAWPQYFAVRIAACQEIADALGDDHDLSVLLQAVTRLKSQTAADAAKVEQLVRARQAELREEAYALSERLFAESPKAFRRRMEAYWASRKALPQPPGMAAPDNSV